MKLVNMTSTFLMLALGATATLGACGDDDGDDDDDGNMVIDAAPDGAPDAMGPAVYVQMEHLARPGIAEALLISNDFLAGYNATAPTFAGVPQPVLDMVVGEAKTVLKAVYLGTCLINGVAGLTPQTGLKPAALACVRVGADMFSDAAGTMLKPDVVTGAQAYADKVFNQFEPDVMRIDTAVTSGYLTPCGDLSTAPLLCGGRQLNEDVIDITYDYLIAGAAIHLDPNSPAQFRALVSDGVAFRPNLSESPGTVTTPDPNNPNQFHPNITTTFPYSAPPI